MEGEALIWKILDSAINSANNEMVLLRNSDPKKNNDDFW